MRQTVLALLIASALGGQTPLEIGPSPIREMFPLFLMSLSYQATNPTPLGKGKWHIELDAMRANTFEFSYIFKEKVPIDAQGRILITRDFVIAHAPDYAHLPLVFFFDCEVERTTLHVRHGLTDKVDLWARLPFQSMGGGRLDGLIEGFHKLGFEQFGRDLIASNRLTLVVLEHGNLRFYRDRGVGYQMQDPVLGVNAELLHSDEFRLGASIALKPALTTTFGIYKTGWEQSYSLTGRWQKHPYHVLYFGAGFIARPLGNKAFASFPFGRMRNGQGAHLGWEYRKNPRFRPFFHLLWQSPYLHQQPYQKLHRSSLQHDLGLHYPFSPQSYISLHYQNNIDHFDNTADMGLGLSLAHRF